MARTHPGSHENLPLGCVVIIERADLEQACIREAAIGIAACRCDEPGQQRWTHDIEIDTDWIDEPQFRLDAAEPLGLTRGYKRERHCFDETALGERAAHQLRPSLRRRERRARERPVALEWHGRNLVIALNPEHLLDEVGLPDDVAAPRGRFDREDPGRQGLDLAPEGGKDPSALLMRDMETTEGRRPVGPQYILTPPVRHRTGGDNIRGLTAADFKHQPGCDFQSVPDEGRIEAALEAIARIACDGEPAARRGGAHRVEQRGFDEDLRRRFAAARALAADDPAETLHAA